MARSGPVLMFRHPQAQVCPKRFRFTRTISIILNTRGRSVSALGLAAIGQIANNKYSMADSRFPAWGTGSCSRRIGKWSLQIGYWLLRRRRGACAPGLAGLWAHDLAEGAAVF
jgi:hypothetical protein